MYRKTFTAEDPALTMTYPGFVFRVLRKDGCDTEALLAGTGMTEALFDDPNFRCSYWQLRRFIQNATALTGDVHLGPRLAVRFDPNHIGLPGYAAMSAARFQDALRVANRFFFLTFPAMEMTILHGDGEPAPGEAAIRLRLKLSFGDVAYFAYGSALVLFEGLFKALLRTERVALRAEMALNEPEGWRAFAPEIGFPVRFEAGENRLFFPAELLNQPLPGADPINHPRLVALCEQFAAEAAFETTLSSQVVAFLETDQNLGSTLAEAASALGHSERGLRRQLERSGASYRRLVDQVRESRARQMLANTALPIQAIAHELGFDSPSNFARSFKRWTGATPKAYRDGRRTRGGSGQN